MTPKRSKQRYSPAACQWIEGEPRADDGCKCGKPTAPGRPYCAEHARRSYEGERRAKALKTDTDQDNSDHSGGHSGDSELIVADDIHAP